MQRMLAAVAMLAVACPCGATEISHLVGQTGADGANVLAKFTLENGVVVAAPLIGQPGRRGSVLYTDVYGDGSSLRWQHDRYFFETVFASVYTNVPDVGRVTITLHPKDFAIVADAWETEVDSGTSGQQALTGPDEVWPENVWFQGTVWGNTQHSGRGALTYTFAGNLRKTNESAGVSKINVDNWPSDARVTPRRTVTYRMDVGWEIGDRTITQFELDMLWPDDYTLRQFTSLPGDANNDDRFTQQDIIQLLQAGTYLKPKLARWVSGDFDGNGFFNQLDMVLAMQENGPNYVHRYPALAVPEPSALVLLSVGALTVSFGRWRRRHKAQLRPPHVGHHTACSTRD